MLKLGDKVRLKACHDSGEAGTVIKAERGKFVIYWPDMDYWSRHPSDSLMLASDAVSGPVALPPTKTGLPATLAALLEQVDGGGL